jgi:hypothetical protein
MRFDQAHLDTAADGTERQAEHSLNTWLIESPEPNSALCKRLIHHQRGIYAIL